MKFQHILLAAAGIVLFAACATNQPIDPCVDVTEKAGFLKGLIQGFIAPITFIISLFSDSIAMYEVNNSGGWYDFGFILGIGGFSGGILKGRRRSRRDR